MYIDWYKEILLKPFQETPTIRLQYFVSITHYNFGNTPAESQQEHTKNKHIKIFRPNHSFLVSLDYELNRFHEKMVE